jgi:type IVB pilus formation R64 PilN family outer membrane protein
MNKRTQVLALSLIALAVTLAGCETKRVNETVQGVDSTAGELDAMTASLRTQKAPAHRSVTFSNEQWVSTQPLAMKKGLPASRDCDVVYNESKSLQQFAQWVSDTCHIPVRVSPDALDYGASYIRSKPGAQSTAIGAPPVAVPIGRSSGDQLADLFPGYTGSANGTSYASPRLPDRMASPLRYSGKLSGLLDTRTGSLGLSWRYDAQAGEITIYYLENRMFEVFALNKGYNFKSEVRSGMSSTAGASSTGQNSSGGSGVSGESGSNMTTGTVMEADMLKDIEATVKSMLTLPDQMAFSKATGTLSITDRPDVLDRVQKYLDAENKKITQQVLINVQIVSVTLTDRFQYGIDWSLVYKSVSGKFGFGLSNTVPGIDSSAISSSISILDTSSSPWAGSKAIINALSQQGRVSAEQSPSVTTLNLQTAPIQIGNVKGYLASSQTTQSANVGSSTALIAGSITSGFNMSLVPQILPRDGLLMQIAINMSAKPTFENITSGDSRIQAPNYDLQIFNQSVKLQSGQTLVLSGFDQTNKDATKTGVGSASNFIFGGGGTSETNRNIIVLMITPIILG